MKGSLSIVLILCSLYLNCSTPKSQTAVVLSKEAPTADLQSYNSYALLPPEADFEGIAISAVEEQLNQRGYTLDPADPDFLVAVHIINEGTDEPVNTSVYSNFDYRGPGYYSTPYQNYYYTEQITVPIVSGYGTEGLNYVAGTIIVDIIDRDKMEIVWRGWAEDQRSHPLDIINDLPGYIVQIFEKFPEEPGN